MAALAVVLALSGCAYYNAMYNAKRYASRADRSERAGRASEAAERWRQVVLHTDTLLARHPHSRWADDAELLKGRALVALGAWPEAVAALENAKTHAGSETQLRQAQYWLGLANAGRRDYIAAILNFDSALASPQRDQRQAVRLARGRTLLTMGRPGEALRDFEAVATPAARFDRALAALALGLPDLAAAHADSAVGVHGIPPEKWAVFLDSLARRGGADEASRLVDRLVAQGALPIGTRARLLLADGDRWAAAGRDSLALARWAMTVRVAPDSAEGRIAVGRQLRQALRGPDAAARLPDVRARLTALASAGGEASRDAREALRLLSLADSLADAGGAPDARAFQAAEWLLDSLSAPALAADAYVGMATRWPESPWAPKAVLAAIVAGHPAADSLMAVLHGRYGESPYARAAAGEETDAEGFAAAEGSLALALEADARATAAEDTAAGRADTEDDRITARPAGVRPARPRATGARPPAPVRAAPVRVPSLPRNPEP